MARSMFHEMNLTKMFFPWATNTIVFLQNLLPSKVGKDQTQFKDWYGYKSLLQFS